MIIFSIIKALSILPLFFFFGYMFASEGFVYLIFGIIGFIIYISAKMVTSGFPFKAIILLPLFFYLGFKFAVTGSFSYIVTGIIAILVYLGIKMVSS
jgi:hypothetical protein